MPKFHMGFIAALIAIPLIILFTGVPKGHSGEVLAIQGGTSDQAAIRQASDHFLWLASHPEVAKDDTFDAFPDAKFLYILHASGINLRPLLPAAAQAYFAITNWKVKISLLNQLNYLLRDYPTEGDRLKPPPGNDFTFSPSKNLAAPDLVAMNVDFLLHAPHELWSRRGHSVLASLASASGSSPELVKFHPDLPLALKRVREGSRNERQVTHTLFIQYQQKIIEPNDLKWLIDEMGRELSDPHRKDDWFRDNISAIRESVTAEDFLFRGYIAFAGWMATQIDIPELRLELTQFLLENDQLDSYERSMALLLLGNYSVEALLDFMQFKFYWNELVEQDPQRFFAFPSAPDQLPAQVMSRLKNDISKSALLQETLREAIAKLNHEMAEIFKSHWTDFERKDAAIRFHQTSLVALNALAKDFSHLPSPSASPSSDNVIDFTKRMANRKNCAALLH